MELAYKIILEAESDHKWRQLGDLAMAGAQFQLAIDCLERAKDYAALLLIYSSQVLVRVANFFSLIAIVMFFPLCDVRLCSRMIMSLFLG